MNHLSIWIEPDGDHVWQVWAEVKTDNFSGRGWCWADPKVLTSFAAKLTAYPMAKAANVLELVFSKLGRVDGSVDDVRIAVSISPLGNLGALQVRVLVVDADDPDCRVTAKMLTGYNERDQFAKQLSGMASGAGHRAVLNGH